MNLAVRHWTCCDILATGGHIPTSGQGDSRLCNCENRIIAV